jgi:hypothetical protein
MDLDLSVVHYFENCGLIEHQAAAQYDTARGGGFNQRLFDRYVSSGVDAFRRAISSGNSAILDSISEDMVLDIVEALCSSVSGYGSGFDTYGSAISDIIKGVLMVRHLFLLGPLNPQDEQHSPANIEETILYKIFSVLVRYYEAADDATKAQYMANFNDLYEMLTRNASDENIRGCIERIFGYFLNANRAFRAAYEAFDSESENETSEPEDDTSDSDNDNARNDEDSDPEIESDGDGAAARNQGMTLKIDKQG